MNKFTSELCDLFVLMPDAQVDEILAFIRELRVARRARELSRPADAVDPDVANPGTPTPRETNGWTEEDRQRAIEQPEDLDE